MTAPVASGWSDGRVGLAPTGKAPPYHGAHPQETFLGSEITAVYRPFSVAHGWVMLLGCLASDAVLDVAYWWLCHRRRDYSADADVWSFRRQWPREKRRIQADLLAGDFRFGLLDRVTLKDGSDIDLWSACDALVLKALTIVLSEILPVSPRCTHIRGHGGAKAAVRQVMAGVPDNRFVLRTDVKSYYASIDHFLLLDQLAGYVKDRRVLYLLGQYLIPVCID